MKHFLELAGPFALYVVFGALWVWIVRLLPEGVPRDALAMAVGVVFVVVYLVLLFRRLRVILGGTPRLWINLWMLGLELGVLVLAFALMHQRMGIVDTTRSGSPVTHDFWSALYFSVVTITTVGYGDLHPTGLGRAVAALQGLTGYLILGSLASTAASMLSPHSRAGLRTQEEREQEEREQEATAARSPG